MTDDGDRIHSWTDTDCWSWIKGRNDTDSDKVRLTLKRWMPKIEAIVSQGGTSPSDFTLHDAEHAFRVAQRIGQLIPPDVVPKIQVYELALLLLSAYLHDIGMTPERRKVSGHYAHLLTGSLGNLSSTEAQEFQAWLDDEGEGIVPPLSVGQVTEAVLHRAQEIITYYCRFRHNDWSEEWIRAHMGGEALGTFANWLEDLIALCRSHHYGLTELRSEKF